jgi:Tyrosine phosphatase family
LTQIAGDARATGDELATGDAGARGEAWVAGGNQARVRELLAADGRRIDLPGLYNLRDVGGYPAAGGPIPWRTLLRSDALHHLDETGVTILASLGLRTIIDLRTQSRPARSAGSALGTPTFPSSAPTCRPCRRGSRTCMPT